MLRKQNGVLLVTLACSGRNDLCDIHPHHLQLCACSTFSSASPPGTPLPRPLQLRRTSHALVRKLPHIHEQLPARKATTGRTGCSG